MGPKHSALALIILSGALAAGQTLPANVHATKGFAAFAVRTQTQRQQGETREPDAARRAKDAFVQGRKFADAKQFDAAIEHFRQAIHLQPDFLLAREWLGLCYVFTNKYQQAINAYNKLIELKPDYENAYGSLGYVYVQLGQYEKAAEASRKIIPTFPNVRPVIPSSLINCSPNIRFLAGELK